jgi:4-coumarate--CoA ligase
LTIYSGWQLVVLERFDMEKVLQTIEAYRITFTYLPPPVILAFAKHPLVDKYDLTSLKVLHSGAAPLTKELTEAVWHRLKIPYVLLPYPMSQKGAPEFA